MNDGEALEAHAQSLEVVQPGNRSFDNPASLAKTAAVRFTATGNLCGNTIGMKWLAVLVVVVSAVALDDGGLGQWPTTLTADGRDRLNQRQ
ncbi:hypothetical protein RM96_21465 [Cupriavidus sp. IDO]|nr:hypothetical protein RM96_21465 [Cupriavidus sp. IDO]